MRPSAVRLPPLSTQESPSSSRPPQQASPRLGLQPSSPGRAQRSPTRRVLEARYVHSVIQALRVRVNSERWQAEHGCSNLQHVWRLWTKLPDPAGAPASAPASARASAPAASPAPAPPGPRGSNARVRPPPGGTAARRAFLQQQRALRHAANGNPPPRGRPPQLKALDSPRRPPGGAPPPPRASPPPRGIDAQTLRLALAFTFPGAPPLGDDEFDMVYRSLDETRRGYVTLSTFSSVFAPRRCDRDGQGGALFYQGLPSWDETIGGYIPKDESEEARRGKRADVGLQHGKAGAEMPADPRGGATAGFGLGHEEHGFNSLGYEMLGHDEMRARGVLKWGEYKPGQHPPGGPRAPRRKSVQLQGATRRRYKDDPRARAAATKIQRAFRIVYAGEQDRWNILRGGAVTRMQAAARRRRQERAYARALWAAMRLQRLFRDARVRRLAAEGRRHRAATRLQARARRRLAAHVHAALLAAKSDATAAAERERQRPAAVYIQQVFRKWHFRRVLVAVRLQRAFRSHLCRRLLKSLREVSRLKALTH